jgi:hypothetical protein
MSTIQEKHSIGITFAQKQRIRVWLVPSFIAEIKTEEQRLHVVYRRYLGVK